MNKLLRRTTKALATGALAISTLAGAGFFNGISAHAATPTVNTQHFVSGLVSDTSNTNGVDILSLDGKKIYHWDAAAGNLKVTESDNTQNLVEIGTSANAQTRYGLTSSGGIVINGADPVGSGYSYVTVANDGKTILAIKDGTVYVGTSASSLTALAGLSGVTAVTGTRLSGYGVNAIEISALIGNTVYNTALDASSYAEQSAPASAGLSQDMVSLGDAGAAGSTALYGFAASQYAVFQDPSTSLTGNYSLSNGALRVYSVTGNAVSSNSVNSSGKLTASYTTPPLTSSIAYIGGFNNTLIVVDDSGNVYAYGTSNNGYTSWQQLLNQDGTPLTIGASSSSGGTGSSAGQTSADQQATVHLTGGDLTLDHSASPIDFGSLQIDDKAHTLNASAGSFDVTDATGSGDGWHVTISATQFTDATSGTTLPAGSLTLRQPTVTGDNGASTDGITVSDPGTVDLTPGNEVTVASAATNEGMGQYTFSQDSSAGNDGATLAVAPNAKTGAYSSTLTYKVVTGP